MPHSNPDTDDERFASIARKPRSPPDSVVATETDDGVLIYDRERSGAWISSTAAVDVANVC